MIIVAVPAIIISAYILRCLIYCFCPGLNGNWLMMTRREMKHRIADGKTVVEDHAMVKSIFEEDPDFTVMIL